MISDVQIKVDNVVVDIPTARVRINDVTTWTRDGFPSARITIQAKEPRESDPWIDKTFEMTVNPGAGSSTVFIGRVIGAVEITDDTGVSYGYEIPGLGWELSQISVRSPFDGTGSVTFNRRTDDPEYDPTYAGMSLGSMIRTLLEVPDVANRLRLRGLAYVDNGSGGWILHSQTVADLTGGSTFLGTYYPTRPVTFAGDSLDSAIRSVLQNTAPNIAIWYDYVGIPTAATMKTRLRFADVTVRTTEKPFVKGQDPEPAIRRQTARSYSRIEVRGGPNIQPMILYLSAGDISENFTDLPWYANNTAAKTAWTLKTWTDHDPRKTKGTCLCRRPRTVAESTPGDPSYIADPTSALLTSPDWLLVNPSPNDKGVEPTWAANAWAQDSDNFGGHVFAKRTNGTGGEEWVTRDVVSNTVLTSGGTSYLQMSASLPGTDYSTFVMTARRSPGQLTWRRYKVNRKTLDGVNAAKRAQRSFPAPLPFLNADGTSSTLTRSGIAEVTVVAGGVADTAYVGFEVDRANESIIFDRPLVTLFGTPSLLRTGGLGVDGVPSEIRVLLPVAQSVLKVASPVDISGVPQYAGTSWTVDGIARTKEINVEDWISDVDTGQMQAWANELAKVYRDTIVEGTSIRKWFDPVYGPGTYATWSDPCYPTTSFARMTSDIRGCVIRWTHSGPVPVVTEYELSNRREPFASQAPRVFHPCMYPIPQPAEPDSFRADSLLSKSDDAALGGTNVNYRGSEAKPGFAGGRIAAEIGSAFAEDGENAKLNLIDAISQGVSGPGNAPGNGNYREANAANGIIEQ